MLLQRIEGLGRRVFRPGARQLAMLPGMQPHSTSIHRPRPIQIPA